ncbi:MAG: hypothetical protein KGZ87_05500 [Bacteroidetes bacterium]|nr:hypothetical protein [Bacteroidota bacterium]
MNEFEKLVFDMRNSQKEYFKTKYPSWLKRSKELEAKVDRYLMNINQPKMKF